MCSHPSKNNSVAKDHCPLHSKSERRKMGSDVAKGGEASGGIHPWEQAVGHSLQGEGPGAHQHT